MVGDNKTTTKNKSVLGATLATSSSCAELQVGAKVDQKWFQGKLCVLAIKHVMLIRAKVLFDIIPSYVWLCSVIVRILILWQLVSLQTKLQQKLKQAGAELGQALRQLGLRPANPYDLLK